MCSNVALAAEQNAVSLLQSHSTPNTLAPWLAESARAQMRHQFPGALLHVALLT